MAFFLIVPSVMIVSVLLIHALANRLGLRIYYATLAAVAIMSFMVTFAASFVANAISREFFIWLGIFILLATGMLTFANRFLYKKQREEEKNFHQEVLAAYEAEKKKDSITEKPPENFSWSAMENSLDEKNFLPEEKVVPAYNEVSIKVDNENDDNISDTADEMTTDDNFSDKADEMTTDDNFSDKTNEMTTDDNFSDKADKMTTDDNFSDTADEMTTDDNFSDTADEMTTDDNFSDKADEMTTDDNFSDKADEMTTDDNFSDTADEMDKDNIDEELNEEPTLPEDFPLAQIFKPLFEPKHEDADEIIKLPEEPEQAEEFPLDEVFKPLSEVKREEVKPPPEKKSKPVELLPLQEVFQPLSTLNLEKIEEITQEEKNLPHEEETNPEEKIATLDELLDKAYEERDKGHVWQAIETYKKALERYQNDEYAPFVAIDLCNIYKEQALYSEAIKIYENALSLPAVKRNKSAEQEFINNLKYLRIVKEILQKHHELSTPFSQLSREILQEVDIEFKKVQYQ